MNVQVYNNNIYNIIKQQVKFDTLVKQSISIHQYSNPLESTVSISGSTHRVIPLAIKFERAFKRNWKYLQRGGAERNKLKG